jgi:hypothetical protein
MRYSSYCYFYCIKNLILFLDLFGRSLLLVYLEQSEPHPNAVPRALSESQETVRTSLGFLFRTEVIRIEFLRIAEVLLVFHEFWTALEKKKLFILCYVML